MFHLPKRPGSVAVHRHADAHVPSASPVVSSRSIRRRLLGPDRLFVGLGLSLSMMGAASEASAAVVTPAQRDLITASNWGTPTSTRAGMNVLAARNAQTPGIRGENVKLAKIGDGKLSNSAHVEFSDLGTRLVDLGGLGGGSTHSQGAASLAIGKNVGAAPNVQQFVNVPAKLTDDSHWDLYGRATEATGPGDVLLLETAWYVPFLPGGETMPSEFDGPNASGERVFDHIRAATDLGRIFIEPVANSGLDLDAQGFKDIREKDANGDFVDSGAIMVGWGKAPVAGLTDYCNATDTARARDNGSNYGSRVDVQGPGCAPGADTTDNTYGQFSGTSGASAVVAGVAAALSSGYEGNTGQNPTPDAVRYALKSSGSAQQGANASERIGPLPNLTAALSKMLAAPATNTPAAGTVNAAGQSTFAFSSPNTGVTYRCRVVPDPLPTFAQLVENRLDDYKPCGTTFTSNKPAGAYRVQVRTVRTSDGNFDPTPASRTFTVPTPESLVTVTITGKQNPPAWTKTRTGGFSFTTSNPAGATGLTYKCLIAYPVWQDCTPSTYFEDRSASGDTNTVYDHGVQIYKGSTLIATDYRQAAFFYDGAAPDTTLTAGPAAGSTVAASGTSFSFSSPNLPSASVCNTWQADGSSCVSFETKIDGGAWTARTNPWSTGTLGAGPHTFRIRAVDLAGNADATPIERTVNVANTTISFTAGPADWSTSATRTPTYAFAAANTKSLRYQCYAQGYADNGSTLTATGPASWTSDCSSPWTLSSTLQGNTALVAVRGLNADDVEIAPWTQRMVRFS